MAHHISKDKRSKEESNPSDDESNSSELTDHGPCTRKLHTLQIKKIVPLNLKQRDYLCIVEEAGEEQGTLSIYVFSERNKASAMGILPTPPKHMILSVHVEHMDQKSNSQSDTEFFMLGEEEDSEKLEI